MKIVKWMFDYRECLVDASTDEEAISKAIEGNRLYEEEWGGASEDEMECITDRNYYNVLGDVDIDWIACRIHDRWFAGKYGSSLVFLD